ncbi:hypothetical protein L195_g044552, partial [Trifolium pratense]
GSGAVATLPGNGRHGGPVAGVLELL